jgi:hypothetical protein
LPDFFHKFLWLKAQAPEVSDEQAITQAIKALRVGQLHSHLVREHPRTLEELYEEFQKFSRAEVLHFRKLDQQKKAQTRTKFQGHSSTARAKKAHQVLSHLTDKFTASTRMDVDHRKIGRKISNLRGQKARIGRMILEKIATKLEAGTQIEAVVGAEFKTNLFTVCSTKETLTIGQATVPSSWNPKRK